MTKRSSLAFLDNRLKFSVSSVLSAAPMSRGCGAMSNSVTSYLVSFFSSSNSDAQEVEREREGERERERERDERWAREHR